MKIYSNNIICVFYSCRKASVISVFPARIAGYKAARVERANENNAVITTKVGDITTGIASIIYCEVSSLNNLKYICK